MDITTVVLVIVNTAVPVPVTVTDAGCVVELSPDGDIELEMLLLLVGVTMDHVALNPDPEEIGAVGLVTLDDETLDVVSVLPPDEVNVSFSVDE